MTKDIHEGRNVKRFREMMGIKQDALAAELGDDWSQKKVSLLESKEKIEPDILEQVASILHVPIEAIKSFSEEAAIQIISSTFNDHSTGVNYHCDLTFNPIEKWVESVEENKRLYETLLKTEREKNALLERMLKEKE